MDYNYAGHLARKNVYISIHSFHIQAAAMIPTVISDEHFGANNVTVTLNWVQKVFSNILPPASVRSVGNRSFQLTIPYNTEYNVSVAICGQPSPQVIKLYYGKCNAYSCLYIIFNM